MRHFLIAAGLTLMASSAMAQTAPQEFVDKAANGGMYEIQSSEIVMSDPAATAAIQAFAKQMIADHTKAAANLTKAAKGSGLTVPMELDAKHQAMVNELSGASSKVPVYLKQQIDAHEEALSLHQGYGSAGTDANLKSYADATAPVIKMHLEQVRMLTGPADKALSSSTNSKMPSNEADTSTGTMGNDSATTGGQGTGTGTSPAAPVK